MQVIDHVLIGPYTAFRIGGFAKHFVYAQNDEEVVAAAEFAAQNNLPFLIMGGGSNILVSDAGFDGLVARLESIGIDIEEEDDKAVLLKVASGEIWDDVVRFAVDQNWYGIENLSHIPGFTGAFAVQNVGAYGQEASQVVEKVDVYDKQTQKFTTLTKEQCQFHYRKSIFNSTEKGRYIILHTYIRLLKNGNPNLSYGDLKKYFDEDAPQLDAIRKAVITIRDTKFPFPDKPTSGNAGSFFRGPLLTEKEFETLSKTIQEKFGADSYNKLLSMTDKLKVPQGYKTPTAFLIELCGLKGFSLGGAKVNEPQPAIVINFTGTATSADVIGLYNSVASKVFDETGVKLHIEPELIGFNPSEISQLFESKV